MEEKKKKEKENVVFRVKFRILDYIKIVGSFFLTTKQREKNFKN